MKNPPLSMEEPNPISRRQKVLVLSLGQALTSAVGVVTAMVLSRVLTREDYATYRQTFLAFTFLMPFLSLGLHNAVYYFLPTEKQRPCGLIVDSIAVLLITGFLFSAFLVCGGNRLLAMRFNNPNIEQTLLYVIPYPLAVLPAQLLSAVLVVRGRVAILSLYNIIKHLCIGGGVIVAALLLRGPTPPLIANIAITIAASGVAIALMLAFSGPKTDYMPKGRSIREIVRFSIPIGLATMLGMISLQLDKIIVSSMCRPEEFAIFANGAVEIPLVGIITGTIASVVLADMRKMVVEGKDRQALGLFKKATEKGIMIIFPAMFFLMIAADPFVKTLFSERYAQSVLPFRLYLLMLPARVVYWGPLMVAIGKSKSVLYRSIGNLVFNLLISLFLVSKIGYVGAIYGSLAATYGWSIVFYTVTACRYFHVKPWALLPWRFFVKVLLRLLLPSSATVLVHLHASRLSSPLALLLDALVFSVLLFSLWPEVFHELRMFQKAKSSMKQTVTPIAGKSSPHLESGPSCDNP